MTIVVGSDHTGDDYRKRICIHLQELGHDVTDIKDVDGSQEYPLVGEAIAYAVTGNKADLGIAFCGTGIGISMAASKVKGTRVALLHDAYTAQMAKEHNNANIIAFGARVMGYENIEYCVDTFMNASFQGDRHQHRLDMVKDIENKQD